MSEEKKFKDERIPLEINASGTVASIDRDAANEANNKLFKELTKNISNYNATTGEYKGSPTITINEGEKRIISFGLKKAKAIVAQYEEIKKFVDTNAGANNEVQSEEGQDN